MAVAKKKRVSKKTKSSWRKHTNISDVENFLEEKRQDELLGQPLSTVSDEQLFKVDTDPFTPEQLSKKEKRLLIAQTMPRCFSALQPHTNVPDPVIKRNRIKTKEERQKNLFKKKEELRKRYGIKKAKEIQSERDRAAYLEKLKNKPKRGDFKTDLWNFEEFDRLFKGDRSEWINKNTRIHSLHGIGIVKKKMSDSLKPKRDFKPAIEPPHPGTSYNPSYGDHRALLGEVVEKEKKIIKEEEHLKRVTKGMFKKVGANEKDSSWLTEMSQGLNEVDQTEESDSEYKPINPPVKNAKKTLKQRRKQKEQLALRAKVRAAKMEKKKVADIHKIRFLKKSVEKLEEKSKKQTEKRLEKKLIKEKGTKRLSSVKYEDPDEVFNMPEDLSGNLRNLKKEGNLLVDRLKSFQKRSLLEPTVIHKLKRAKVKKYVKPGHKDDWKVTVAK